jgi:hypothetical protein
MYKFERDFFSPTFTAIVPVKKSSISFFTSFAQVLGEASIFQMLEVQRCFMPVLAQV